MNPYLAMARNNAWANAVLIRALCRLQPGEWDAPRVGFFPSIRATMEHVHAVDLYYLDAAIGGGPGPRAFSDAPRFAAPGDLAPAQAAQDARLTTLCEGLDETGLAVRVMTDRGAAGRCEERLDLLLLHLFQHQVHHRGQVHAMLSGTATPPPQLDEFFLSDPKEVALRAAELDALGFSEPAIWR